MARPTTHLGLSALQAFNLDGPQYLKFETGSGVGDYNPSTPNRSTPTRVSSVAPPSAPGPTVRTSSTRVPAPAPGPSSGGAPLSLPSHGVSLQPLVSLLPSAVPSAAGAALSTLLSPLSSKGVPPGLEAKTLGSPTLAELLAAQRTGTLQTNAGGKLTTPVTREAAQGLLSARHTLVAAGRPDLSGLSAAERRILPYAEQAHHEYPDIPVSVLMAQDKQESGFDPNAVSEANARGVSQFIPGTAAEYGVHFGSNPQDIQSQVSGQAHLLHDSGFATNPQGALSSYSGGYAASAYNNPILADARANYSQLNQPTHAPPAVRQQYQQAAQEARHAGLTPPSALEVLHGGLGGATAVPAGYQYANPLPASAWSPGRTDEGFDAAPLKANAPILAVSRGRVIADTAPGWPEGGGVTYEILKGPQKGKEVYNFEGLNPTVEPGDIVHRGQVVARGRQGGSVELGYYSGNQTSAGHPLNNTTIAGGVPYGEAPDGSPTIGAKQFERQILGQAVAVPPSGLGAPTVGGAAPAVGGGGVVGGAGGAAPAGRGGSVALTSLSSPLAPGVALPSDFLGQGQPGQEHAESAAQSLLALLGQEVAAVPGSLLGRRPTLYGG